MKIFDSGTLKEIDRATCEAQKINSMDLMERAASAVSCEIVTQFFSNQRIVVIAGSGNNGGDALVVARNLIEQGYSNVEVYLFNVTGKLAPDCEEARKRLITVDGIKFVEVVREFAPPQLGRSDVVVDGLFGSGLRSPLQGGYKAVAKYINESEAYVISIDVPSGLFGEWNDSTIPSDMVHADLTLTFQQPRLSFFFSENAPVLGEVKILDIDIDRDVMLRTQSNYTLVEEPMIKAILKPRRPFSGKRDYGSVMLFAGSMGMVGASILAAKAALKCGCGLATVHGASCGMIPVQAAVPEAMFEPDKNERRITDMRLHHDHQAVIVGPGIGTHEDTIEALEGLLKNTKSPLIIDADALNCIAKRPSMLSLLPPKTIITPHIGEFDRLFGEHRLSEQRLKEAIKMAKFYNIIIVLKGHYTAVVRPTGKVFFNSTGNAGMATAGAGDVLTGMIASFVAQGYRPEQAATLAVYLHGMAGDMAAEKLSQWSVTAGDIIQYVGPALEKITRS